jgi:hypothetical protein
MPQGVLIQEAGILSSQEQTALAHTAWGQQLQHGPSNGAFAAAGRAHQSYAVATPKREIEAIQSWGGRAWIAHDQPLQIQHLFGVLMGRDRGGGRHGGEETRTSLPARPLCRWLPVLSENLQAMAWPMVGRETAEAKAGDSAAREFTEVKKCLASPLG